MRTVLVLTACVVAVAVVAVAAAAATAQLKFSPAATKVPIDIHLSFTTTFEWLPGENATLRLPRITSGAADGTDGGSIAMGKVHITKSVWFAAAWEEGTFDQDDPYAHSQLVIQNLDDGETWLPGAEIQITVLKHNGLKAFCGFPSNWTNIQLLVPSDSGLPLSFQSNQVGNGCRFLHDCGSYGNCNYCYERCECERGWGHVEDLALAPYTYCQGRTCPVGFGLIIKDDAEGFVHAKECSGQGLCDYRFGTCNCLPGFSGVACEQRACPNKCSGHGSCVSMREAANRTDALPLSEVIPEYSLKDAEMPWDWDVMHLCVCASSWPVGLESGETQEPEWFGADCSQRRCPSGDDPATPFVDETDCSGIAAEGGKGVGKPGNKCHVDCSNRGVCNHRTGTCTCVDGYLGANCGTLSPFAGTKLLRKLKTLKGA